MNARIDRTEAAAATAIRTAQIGDRTESNWNRPEHWLEGAATWNAAAAACRDAAAAQRDAGDTEAADSWARLATSAGRSSTWCRREARRTEQRNADSAIRYAALSC